ncbi:MAG: beta-ketoacyl-ACP synthase III [bacterium]
MRRSRIVGVGHYLPPRVVTNKELEQYMDTSDEWIRERSGIETRHWVDPGTSTSDLALEASKAALENANLEPEQLDFIVLSTLMPDYYFPGSGVILQRKLGLKNIGALDVRTQCTGFIYGLSVADQFIRTGMYNRVLVVGAEVHSKGLDISTRGRDVSVLFGDGAGAVVLEANDENRGILSSHLHADGNHAEQLWVEYPGSAADKFIPDDLVESGRCFPLMEGREVFKSAVVRFTQVINEALVANNLSRLHIKLVIPHQANKRITEAVEQRLELQPGVVFSNIEKYGNTTAASIPIALSEALQQGLIEDGDFIILAAFGSGFTWASAAIRW